MSDNSNAIASTLNARGNLYGDFTHHADVTQKLKRVVEAHIYTNTHKFLPMHLEALDMILHKIGRIVNGDPNYADSWHDIAGYATLVEQRISKP